MNRNRDEDRDERVVIERIVEPDLLAALEARRPEGPSPPSMRRTMFSEHDDRVVDDEADRERHAH